jgi:hypothetical protein
VRERGEEPDPFSRRVVPWIAGAAAASLLLAALFGALGSDLGTPRSRGASSFSPSVLGTEAFRTLLGEVGIPVVASREDSGRRAGSRGLLVIVAPEDPAAVEALVEDAEHVLLVLPKWSGRVHPLREDWVSGVDPVPAEVVATVLQAAGVAARTRQARGPVGGWTDLDGLRPDLEAPILLEGEDLEPVISCGAGVLLAKAGDHAGAGSLWILSDPDLLATGGLGRGDNGALAVRIVETLRPGSGAVFLDETVHGFRRESGVWREMLRFPLVAVTIHVLAAVLLAATAGARRFGAPADGDAGAEPGKRVLVANTARLLLEGGHAGSVLARYGRTAFRGVAEAHRAPGIPGSADSIRFLDRAGEGRGRGGEASRLAAELRSAVESGESRASRLTAIAVRIHAWREEMTRGH